MAEGVTEREVRKGREGGRWINERPSSEEFVEWFSTSMKLDAALNFEDYIGGVVLIPGVDNKAKHVVGFSDKGEPVIEEWPELSYVPYAKVETRIDYFWDLLDAHEEWVAVVEHVKSERIPLDFITVEEREVTGRTESGDERERTINRKIRQPGALTAMVHQLPEGFSIMSIPVGEGYSHFLCCTIRVSIFRASDDRQPIGRPLRTGRGTKQVPLTKRGYQNSTYADDSSLMKAETGALGRALGFAGIFVIPGSGVATAEDVLEALAQGQTPTESGEAAASLPPAEGPVRTPAESAQDEEERLRARAVQIYKQLSEESPGKAEEFGRWAQSRRLRSLGDARGAMLKGVVKKLEKLADQADESPEGTPEIPGPESPSSAVVGDSQTPAAEGDQPTGDRSDVPTETSTDA